VSELGGAGSDWLPALPFDTYADAERAALSLLDQLGCGRWTVEPAQASAGWWSERPSVPLVLLDGTLAAALRFDGPGDPAAIDADVLQRVRSIAKLLVSVLDAHRRVDAAKQRAERAEEDSLTDLLTGLPNSRAWWQALRREVARGTRHGDSVVVAVVDLDGFKMINDRQGHLAGDLLLRMAALTLRGAVRQEDVVARIGGDEFGIIAVGFDSPVPAALVGRVRAALDANDVAASVGATLHRPGEDLNTSYSRADEAMYADKRERRAGLAPDLR
jgi:diguanylate cyclase (GGDEF)-like protein